MFSLSEESEILEAVVSTHLHESITITTYLWAHVVRIRARDRMGIPMLLERTTVGIDLVEEEGV